MARKAHGQIRQNQVITTWGPGALLDLPTNSVIVGGLDTWPRLIDLDEIIEPRMTRKLQLMTGIQSPGLYNPPGDTNNPAESKRGIGVWQFPEWFVVQDNEGDDGNKRSRRLINRRKLDDNGRYEKLTVVPTRFVCACPRGHIDDLDWYRYAHGAENNCRGQLWLDEQGTSGDLADLVVRCECGRRRSLYEATQIEDIPLGICRGSRPWLGQNSHEDCNLPSRLLIRTAANAYFPQVVSILSIPDRVTAIKSAVDELWDDLQIVDDLSHLQFLKKKPKISDRLDGFYDEDVLETIIEKKEGSADDRPAKLVELEAILSAPEGYGDDVPIDPNFHARKLPTHIWQTDKTSGKLESVIQLHRLREVLVLAGFTRFEAVTPDINGEYDTDVQRAELSIEPSWFPAVENRGEGIFIQLNSRAVKSWIDKPSVNERIVQLSEGHRNWLKNRRLDKPFPGGPYILLHTISHLLIQSLAMRCGYPASSIRERIYADYINKQYGILLYTGSPDAEGTLGGLVQQARNIEAHLTYALRTGALCSNDPICAQHSPGESMESRWLQGAACHACALVAETSCEMRNDYLDRALVVPTLDTLNSAFFTEGD